MLRRGPSDWWHVGRWDTREPRFEPGAWFRGALYPQRCDLSPDGRWLCTLALKPGARASNAANGWEGGDTYVAVSRLPWLEALVAWDVGSTYSRGAHFVPASGGWDMPEPSVGDCAPCRRRFGLRPTAPVQFAVERRRGWRDAADSPPRDPGDAWDERRTSRIEKACPARPDGPRLRVEGLYAAFRGLPEQFPPSESFYSLARRGEEERLDDVAWADWRHDGRLLVATREGALQIRDVSAPRAREVLFEVDLHDLRPDPNPAPGWASSW